MKAKQPKHITNIEYQDFYNVYYYITYPGVKPYLYGINLYGDVISLVKNREKYRKFDVDNRGYRFMKLRGDKQEYIKVGVSRLVAWEFVGQPENYNELQINHADGINYNNYYKNLEWTTPEENSIHKTIYGLAASAEKHGWNVHSEKVVRHVIKMIIKGYDAPTIANIILDKYPDIYSRENKHDYDRIRGLVSKIKTGASWHPLKNEMEGSTTIENIIYEKHIGEEVSRVGLHPIAVLKDGHFIFGDDKIK